MGIFNVRQKGCLRLLEHTVRDAAIQTVFAVQIKIVFFVVGSAQTSSDVLAASYGADTQWLLGKP